MLLIAAVQFVNVLDFVIVMPLGPDFAAALGVTEAALPYVAGAYTGAACVAGIVSSLFLDRFDRRQALAVAMLGLVVGTAAGGLATRLSTLLMARVVAGCFGGPATSLSFSIIADSIPAPLRGRAMGTVMSAFSIASVFGVPVGLWLGESFSWRAPFFAVAGVGLLVCAVAILALPEMKGHLKHRKRLELGGFLSQRLVQQSYLMTAVVMMAGFVIVPNIAAHLQFNLGLPREDLKYAYGAGGLASFLSTQLGGRAVDRFGSFRVGTVGACLVILVVFGFFYWPHQSALPVWLILGGFFGFMVANGLRNVSYNTLTTKVPSPEVRAGFQSLQSATQHGASAVAAVLSASMLTSGPERRLLGMDRVALLSMGLSLAIPGLLFVVERGVKLNARRAAAAATSSGG